MATGRAARVARPRRCVLLCDLVQLVADAMRVTAVVGESPEALFPRNAVQVRNKAGPTGAHPSELRRPRRRRLRLHPEVGRRGRRGAGIRAWLDHKESLERDIPYVPGSRDPVSWSRAQAA